VKLTIRNSLAILHHSYQRKKVEPHQISQRFGPEEESVNMLIYRVCCLLLGAASLPRRSPTRSSVLTITLPQDITTANKDEIISDTFKLIDVGDGLWEVDCRMINKGGDNFGMCHQMRFGYLSVRAVDFS
jgi:hypothetical protein